MNSLRLLEANNSFQYLKDYYNKEDFATRYGVDRTEIRHSNFLAWIFDPSKSHSLNDLGIRKLLEFLVGVYPYSKDLEYIISSKVYLIDSVSVSREKYNIDILISLKVNDKPINIIIENKVYALLDDMQLNNYRQSIESNLTPDSENIYLYLHPTFNDEHSKAMKDGYYSITYQDIYDKVLKPAYQTTCSIETKIALEDYIHCLSKPVYSDYGLVVTDEEVLNITGLVKEYKQVLLEVLNDQGNIKNKQFFEENKRLLTILFDKCKSSKIDIDEDLKNEMAQALKKRVYSFQSKECKSIRQFVKAVFDYLIEQGNTYTDLEQLINITGDDKLIVLEEEIPKQHHPRYYDNFKDYVSFGDGKKYYILNAWYSEDYITLRENIKKLYPNLGL